MKDVTRLVGFGVVLAAALGVGYGAGATFGPEPEPQSVVESGADVPAAHQ
ncbi:MAG: hypothetical protein ACYC1Z_06215 [Georgenia sp.]